MPFANLGFTEIAGLLILGLLVFGAKRLPEIGASMGKGIKEFKKSLTDMQEEISTPAPQRRAESPARASLADGEEERSDPKRLI